MVYSITRVNMATQDKDRVFSMTRVNMVNRIYKGMGTQDI